MEINLNKNTVDMHLHIFSKKSLNRNYRHINWKTVSKIVIISRWHDSVLRKACSFHQKKKTTQPNKWIWQNSRKKSQYSEIEGVFVHHNEISETKTRGEIPFSIATRKIKYLGVNLTKEVKDLSLENYRTLKKEIKKDRNKWKHILCSWIGRINIIKMSIIPKAIYRFNAISTKIPMSYFTDLVKYFTNSSKIYMEQKMTLNSLSNIKKEEQGRRDHNTWYQTILKGYKATIIKTAWYWHKNRHIDQWNRIESPEIYPCLYGQLIFDKEGRGITWS